MWLFNLLFSSLSQLWYVEVRISRSVSVSLLEFEITRVDCIWTRPAVVLNAATHSLSLHETFLSRDWYSRLHNKINRMMSLLFLNNSVRTRPGRNKMPKFLAKNDILSKVLTIKLSSIWKRIDVLSKEATVNTVQVVTHCRLNELPRTIYLKSLILILAKSGYVV